MTYSLLPIYYTTQNSFVTSAIPPKIYLSRSEIFTRPNDSIKRQNLKDILSSILNNIYNDNLVINSAALIKLIPYRDRSDEDKDLFEKKVHKL